MQACRKTRLSGVPSCGDAAAILAALPPLPARRFNQSFYGLTTSAHNLPMANACVAKVVGMVGRVSYRNESST